jgi:hypothetical protein
MKTFAFETLFQTLRSQKSFSDSPRLNPILEKSYREVDSFQEALLSFHTKRLQRPTTTLYQKQYDLYGDAISRHKFSTSLAVKVLDETHKVKSWTYEQLDLMVNDQLELWMAREIKKGDQIALILSPGITYLVAFLTALRLGLRIAYFPLESPYLSLEGIREKLEGISPLFVVVSSEEIGAEFPFPSLVIEHLSFKEKNPAEKQVFYAPDDLVFSEGTAERVYFSALRDGELLFAAEPKEVWAAPLRNSLREEPYLTLTALLMGTTIFYIPDQLIRQSPTILQEISVDILGISGAFLDLCLEEKGFPNKKPRICYRHPLERSPGKWEAFSSECELKKIPFVKWMIDPQRGESLLFSFPTPDPRDFRLIPSLGSSWELVNEAGEENSEGFGRFKFEEKETNFCLAPLEKGWVMTEVLKRERQGIEIPAQKIEEIVIELPFVQFASLLCLPRVYDPLDSQVVLIIFTHPALIEKVALQEEVWGKEIQTLIITRIGEGFIPDKIEYFPLYPKLKEGKVNQSWCFNQYRDGRLSKKKRLLVYHHLSMLKASIKEDRCLV